MIKRTTELTDCEYHSLAALADKQDRGEAKYGHGIYFEDTNYDWIEECIEELADGLQYAVAAKMRRDYCRTSICTMLDILDVTDIHNSQIIVDIKEMLELL